MKRRLTPPRWPPGRGSTPSSGSTEARGPRRSARCAPPDLGLTSGDYGVITERLVRLVEPGRVIAFLEGGYDLEALATSVVATVAALAGDHHLPEAPTSAGLGRNVVDAALKLHGLDPDV